RLVQVVEAKGVEAGTYGVPTRVRVGGGAAVNPLVRGEAVEDQAELVHHGEGIRGSVMDAGLEPSGGGGAAGAAARWRHGGDEAGAQRRQRGSGAAAARRRGGGEAG